jgi:ABC-type branched-subunit amino acid transport system ATPase component/ABC-type branched-subunit amino acid transport system permease subunit
MSFARCAFAVFLAAAALLPFTGWIPGWTPSLVITVSFKAVALLGLNLIFGVVGMLAFGQAAFMALPGYILGVLVKLGVTFPFAAAAGFFGTIIVARLVAEVFVRLPGIYLAVGTLGFGFALEGLARAFPYWTGGASGLVFAQGQALSPIAWYAVAILTLAVALGAFAAIARGGPLRMMRTIRHDELAAAVLGIDVAREKARVFTIGSTFAAAGGLLLALYVGVLIPEDAGVSRSLEQIGTVLLGGAGTVIGPLVGTAIVDWLLVVAGYGARYELLIYGIAFLGVVIFAPNGIVGWFARSRPSSASRPGMPAVLSISHAAAVPTRDRAARTGVCLTIEHVRHRFSGLLALDDISFAVHYGEIFTLVGPNGAGKSTLFNIISGILAPTEGSLILAGIDLRSLSIHRRAPLIGRSFQVARLVPSLSARENVMVRLDQIASELTESERDGIATAQLEYFGLDALKDAPVRTLSLGQQKLIDLARASVGNPQLVLLDEPAVGLSHDELNHLAKVLAALRERQSAVIIVEHNIEFVASVAQQGVVLDGGRPIASGPVKEILADPKVRDAYFGALT